VSGPAGLVSTATLFAFDEAESLELAERHGTPCFAYRRSVAENGWRRLRAALPERVRLAYAVKANPHPALLRSFAALGADFDCASEGELRAASVLRRGARLFFAGPGKREPELALAVALGARVQAEGLEDLAQLDALARARGAIVSCNLRVHPLACSEEPRRILGGSGPSAFGVDEEQVPQLLDRAARLEHERVRGLHVFAASNQRDVGALLETHVHVLGLARRLSEQQGLMLEQIDLGGGLGVPYAADETSLDVEALGAGLARLLEEHAWFGGELVLEPGRWLAAPCGVYLTRVVRTKLSRGTRFAILEGGINHLLRPLLTGQAFPVRKVGAEGAVKGTPTVLAGPLCSGLDRLGEAVLPGLLPGDLLAFGMAGAYGFSEAMGRFLSHPEPPEIWVD
jgi:diaminopimelate decarboxylase